MRILELARSFFPSAGGLENFVHNRLKIYESLGIEYIVACTTFSTEKNDYSRFRPDTVFLKQYSPYNITPGLIDFLRSTHFDILSLNQTGRFFSDYALSYCRKKNISIILTPHFTFHTGRYGFIKRVYNRHFLPSQLAKADRIICFTNEEKMFWTRVHSVSEDKINVIPHYITMEHESISRSQNADYFLYLGRYDKNKRLDILLKGFHSSSLPCSLYLTIDRDVLPGYLQSIAESDPRIKLLGNVNELVKFNLLTGMQALILPTDFEAFGTVLLEASCFGKPVLCSDMPVLREIMDEKGVIFFENNAAGLRQAMAEFSWLTSEEKKMMGLINKNNLNRYTFRSSREAYASLFEELIPGCLKLHNGCQYNKNAAAL